MQLRQLDDGLWVVDGPLKRLGIEFGHRMTVFRSGRGCVLRPLLSALDRALP